MARILAAGCRANAVAVGAERADGTPRRGCSQAELGHRLHLKVVAEGIENEAQAQALQACGCDIGQGYHFSRPVPMAALERWIATRWAASVSDE
jgi:predicted signal transduction protein with EAL and GGDEF domain